MDRSELVVSLEEIFLSELKGALIEFKNDGLLQNSKFSNFEWENENGESAYSVQLQCVLPGKLEGEIDELILTLSFENVMYPKAYELELSWGFPSNYIEHQLANCEIGLGGEATQLFLTDLRQMLELLRRAILRSYPKDDYAFRNRNAYR